MKSRVFVWAFLTLLATYVILGFVLPTDPQTLSKHGLTELGARLLNLSVVIPISLIYLSALYGFVHVNNYANKVLKTKEGQYFKRLAEGLALLVFSLPVSSLLSSFRSYLRHVQPDLFPTISILRNYLILALVFAAMFLIAKGAQGLYGTLKSQKETMQQLSFYGIIAPVLLASVYTWLVVSQNYSTAGGGPYFLPEWLIVLTIIVPYVFVWCLGIRAAAHLFAYQVGVKGVIYKRAIKNLAVGIAVIILISILVQGITSLNLILSRLDLTPLLVIVYFLIALYVVGYGLVARGAKKLKQIEEA